MLIGLYISNYKGWKDSLIALSLSNTLLIQSFSNKLMSMSQAIEELNCIASIYPTFCLFRDILTKEIIRCGLKIWRLYHMDDFNSSGVNNVQHLISVKEKQIWLWHHCLGYSSFSYMQYLFPQLFLDLDYLDFNCDTCISTKSHHVSFPTSSNKSDVPFVLIHSDVWGPSLITTLFGIRWFMTFIDDYTQMTWLYLLKHEDERFGLFYSFQAMIQNQY